MGIIKTQREIKLLKKSAEITSSCLPIIEEALKENKITEKEIVRRLRRKLKSQGAKFSFVPIVSCGKRSAKIHAKPRSTKKIISGIGMIDFGACYKGYKTDMTVPFIKGKINKKERRIVDSVVKAYDIGVKSIRIGMPCWKLFEKVDNFLRKQKFKMGHSLGHGLGLKIHELPYIGKPRKKVDVSKKMYEKMRKRWEKWKKITFQNNMVFTIEPGVYIKGVGGCRLENDILIENKRIKVLTNAKLIEV
jgi:Xaa-Pro aminopeptidase